MSCALTAPTIGSAGYVVSSVAHTAIPEEIQMSDPSVQVAISAGCSIRRLRIYNDDTGHWSYKWVLHKDDEPISPFRDQFHEAVDDVHNHLSELS